MLTRVKSKKTIRSGGYHQPLGRFCLVNPRFDRFHPALPNSNPGEFYVNSKCFDDADATVKSVSANDKRKKNSVSANAAKPANLKP